MSHTHQSFDLLLTTLEDRFHQFLHRHKDIQWSHVKSKLLNHPDKLFSLQKMEAGGGAPDLVQFDHITQEFIFMDCSVESPSGRRSLCYDKAAWLSRKENKPAGSAMEFAMEMGVTLLTETEYRYLQSLGDFDMKTSSWLLTPESIRSKGGAIFGDKRYGQTFIYHNGAESYYAARGFRTVLKV